MLYAVLVSLPGSVLRAAGMALLVLGATVAGRRADGLRLLGLLFWANMVWQPSVMLDTGLRLSYLAAAGLIAGSRLVGPRLASLPRIWRTIVAGLTATLSAQTATMIEVGGAFGRLNLLSPAANLVGVPLFSLAVCLGAVGLVLGLLWPWAGDGLLAVTAVYLRLLGVGGTAAATGAGFAEIGLPGFGPLRVVVVSGAGLGAGPGAGAARCRGDRGGKARPSPSWVLASRRRRRGTPSATAVACSRHSATWGRATARSCACRMAGPCSSMPATPGAWVRR